MSKDTSINIVVTYPYGDDTNSDLSNYYRKFALTTGGLYLDMRISKTQTNEFITNVACSFTKKMKQLRLYHYMVKYFMEQK